jgi:hypothetical protein
MTKHKKCPTCDAPNDVSAVVCTNCGASIIGVDISSASTPGRSKQAASAGKTCPECSATNPESAAKCLYCEASLPPASTELRTRITVGWPWGAQVVVDSLRVGREPPAPGALIEMLAAHGFDNVSRQHAEFRIVDGEAVIVDLGSSNGTFMNGARLTATVPEKLPERATVRFGADLEVAICVASDKAC